MKHFYLFIFLILLSFSSFAQNTFPTAANSSVGIGTTTPTSPLDVNGATRLRLAVEMSNNQFFAFNAYNNATAPAGWKYRVAGFASSFVQNAAGTFTFNLGNSTSGAINTAVTWRPVYTILNSGNIGIGSITPDSRLDVVGNLAGKSNFRALGTAAKLTIDNNATGQNLYDAGLHLFRDNSGVERVRIDGATGSMGLGLSSAPLALLHLGGASNKGLRINTVLNNAAFLGGWQDQAVLSVNRNAWDGTFTDATKTAASIQLEGLATGSNIQFLTSPTINTLQLERMRIIANGNVGIGLVTPAYPLDINGEMQSKGNRINAAAGYSALDYFSLEGTNNAILGTVGAVNTIVNGSAVGDFVLRTTSKPILFSTDGGTTTHIKITNTGQVGIGTAAPTAKLEVNSGLSNNSGLKFTNLNSASTPVTANGKALSVNAAGEVIMVNAASGGGGVAIDSTVRRNISFENGPGSFGTAQKMSILNNGNVGIGVASPSALLQIANRVKFNVDGTINWGSAFDGGLLSWDTGSAIISGMSGKALSFGSNGTFDKLYLSTNGNVGIGTSTPSTPLNIRSTSPTIKLEASQNPSFYFTDIVNQYDGAEKFFIKIGDTKSFGNKLIFGGQPHTYLNGYQGITFTTGVFAPDSNNIQMHISNSGNVGFKSKNPINTIGLGSGNTGLGFYSANNAFHSGKIAEIKANELGAGYGDLLFNTYGGGTGGGERMRILGNGNVGIGISAPTSTLDINGGTRLRGMLEMPTNTDFVWNAYYAAGAWKYRSNGFAGGFYQEPGGALAYNVAPTGTADAPLTFNRAFTVINNGNFGIGTAAPTSKLEVNSGTAGASGLKFTNLNSASTSIASNGKALSVNTAGEVVLVNAPAITLPPVLDSSQIKMLFVGNNKYLSYAPLTVNQTTPYSYSGVFSHSGAAQDRRLIIGYENAGMHVFSSSHSGGNAANLFFNVYGGNVGIGTNSPTQKFEIGGTRPLTYNPNLGSMKMKADSGGWAMNYGFLANNGTDLGGFWGHGSVNSLIDWRIGKQYTDKTFVVKSSGNIGIGTDSPEQKLELSASGDVALRLHNTLANAWDIKNSVNGVLDFIRGGNNNYLRIDQYGSIGMGTTTPKAKLDVNGTVAIGFEGALAYPVGYKLAVDGNIIAEKVKVKNSTNWPDFVFKKEYKLPSLDEVEKYVKENSHLPEIPSAAEVEKEGQDLGEMNRLLLKKVEELTLYIIEQNKDIKSLKDKNTKLESLESELAKIKAVLKIKD